MTCDKLCCSNFKTNLFYVHIFLDIIFAKLIIMNREELFGEYIKLRPALQILVQPSVSNLN